MTAADDAGRLDLDAVEARAKAVADQLKVINRPVGEFGDPTWAEQKRRARDLARRETPAMLIDIEALVAELRAAREAEARVRSEHPRVTLSYSLTATVCDCCATTWPCPTIAALDGTS